MLQMGQLNITDFFTFLYTNKLGLANVSSWLIEHLQMWLPSIYFWFAGLVHTQRKTSALTLEKKLLPTIGLEGNFQTRWSQSFCGHSKYPKEKLTTRSDSAMLKDLLKSQIYNWDSGDLGLQAQR